MPHTAKMSQANKLTGALSDQINKMLQLRPHSNQAHISVYFLVLDAIFNTVGISVPTLYNF